MATSLSSAAAAFPLAEADLCVKCGLCLPHCPTYLDLRNEADSPRGRIALMQGLAMGAITQSASLEDHLDGCLSCRACEAVCPAKVPYGLLIDSGRAVLAQQRPARVRALAVLSGLLSRRSARRIVAALLRFYQRSGVQQLVRATHVLGHGNLARLEGLLPQIDAVSTNPPMTSARSEPDEVLLFAGCIGDIAERRLRSDAARLFDACGYQLRQPSAQTCCGALDQHGGRPAAAQRLARINLDAFTGTAPITAMASGCGASLLDYASMLGEDARAFSARVRDPMRLLLIRADRLRLAPLAARVAIHLPCTQKNVLRDAQATRELLAKIPGITLLELDTEQRCCGAAGLHFVTHPAQADRLLAPKLAAARALAPDYIVSANIGCALHLAAGLRRDGTTVPVLHPLTLLAQQLMASPESRHW